MVPDGSAAISNSLHGNGVILQLKDKNKYTIIRCIQDSPINFKDTEKLRVKGRKKTDYANTNQRKAG